jgi:hypothetical protein
MGIFCNGKIEISHGSVLVREPKLDVCTLQFNMDGGAMKCNKCGCETPHKSKCTLLPKSTTQAIVFSFDREVFRKREVFNERKHPVCIPHVLGADDDLFVISLVGHWETFGNHIKHWKLFAYDKFERKKERGIDRGWHELNDRIITPAQNQAIVNHAYVSMAIYVRANQQQVEIIQSRVALTTIQVPTNVPYEQKRGADDEDDAEAEAFDAIAYLEASFNDALNSIGNEILTCKRQLKQAKDPQK